MKKLLAICTCMLMILAMAACENATPSISSPAVSSGEDSAQNDSKSETKLSDKLSDAQIQINGDIYTVPCTFQDFFDNGWTAKEDVENREAAHLSGGSVAMENGDSYLVVSFSNTSGEKKMAADCPIDQISINAEYNPNTEMMMPGGITFGVGIEDLKTAYGEPDDEYLGSYYTQLTYELIGDPGSMVAQNYILFTVYDNDGLVGIDLNRTQE